MSEPRTLNGLRIDLPQERHVFVAKVDDCSFIEFKSPEGNITHLKLSKEASDALWYLLKPAEPNEVIKSFLTHMTQASLQPKAELAWQLVKTDETPHPAVRG